MLYEEHSIFTMPTSEELISAPGHLYSSYSQFSSKSSQTLLNWQIKSHIAFRSSKSRSFEGLKDVVVENIRHFNQLANPF